MWPVIDTLDMRRKWTLRVRSITGEDAWLVITVPSEGDGTIHVSVGRTSWQVRPEDVAKLRRHYLEALERALNDRGHW